MVIVEFQNNHAIITESNVAYKSVIRESVTYIIEEIITDCIVNSNSRQIKIEQNFYNLQIEKIDECKFSVWFCKIKCNSKNINEKSSTDITNIRNYYNWDKGEVMCFISHEIKNPLNMILATMQLIEKKAEKNIYPKDILQHVELVKRNSFRIMKIVNDLSSKSKIELGYETFNPTNQDIVYFVEDICESVRDFVNINEMNIIFDTDIEELVVGFDSEKIEKIVYMPRNDDNFIRLGDQYELFYQDGFRGWISLGRQVASELTLHYDNIPQNSVLWLRNLSRGREETVFRNEDGRQVFFVKW